jgi:hypothetical protein
MHKNSPEKGNATSTPTCCNCQLAEREKAHPANYRGCRHAKEHLQKRKSQGTPKTTTGRAFSSNLTTTGVSFAAALRGSTQKQQRPQALQVTVESPSIAKKQSVPAPAELQQTGQSVRATNVNSLSPDRMLKVVVTAVQQIMTESNGAVLEEAKI